MSDAETLAVYADRAQDYARLTDDASNRPELTRFIAGLPAAALVLDIGCGPGFAAGVMAAKGMKTHAWDPVPEMVEMAARHDGVTARQATYDDLTANDVYDGIWANFSMLHTPRAKWPAQLAAVARALKPGGLFHLGTKLGTGEARDSIGRLYSYVTEADLMDLLAATGFTVEYSRTGQEAGLSGEIDPFIVLQARA